MDFTNPTTPNLEAFIKRYPELVQEALESANNKIRLAQTRVNASHARLIKARIGQKDVSKAILEYNKNFEEYTEAINHLYRLQECVPKYLEFLLAPKNDYIRHELDREYAEWTCFEDVIYNINDVYLNEILEHVEYECTCGANDSNYQHCLYFETNPERHIYIDYKGTCSHGTKMTLVGKEVLLNSMEFTGNSNIDILKLEVF